MTEAVSSESVDPVRQALLVQFGKVGGVSISESSRRATQLKLALAPGPQGVTVTALLQAEDFPIGFNRSPAEGASTWFCGYVNMKDAPGSEDKAYDFINSMMAHGSAQALLDELGYAHSNTAAMADIPLEAQQAAFVDQVSTPLLAQSPVSSEFREKMIQEFENIKAGF